ncbi:MAG: ATP-binding protein [Actinobacteria bacterium]|nr:ATP-binding protein [Actinomycetota bacterium]
MTTSDVQTGRPRAIEILGPPGAGKSTLMKALGAAAPDAHPLSIYCTPRNLPVWIRSAWRVLPELRSPASLGDRPWRQRKWIIRLQASEGILRREAARESSVLVFDQGPVYTLAWLRGTPQSSALPEGRVERAIRFWAHALDALIMLDAPNEVLLNRIRDRTKPHSLCSGSYASARRGLVQERSIHEAAIEELTAARPSLPVIRFDTSEQAPGHMAAATLRSLGLPVSRARNAEGSGVGHVAEPLARPTQPGS